MFYMLISWTIIYGVYSLLYCCSYLFTLIVVGNIINGDPWNQLGSCKNILILSSLYKYNMIIWLYAQC